MIGLLFLTSGILKTARKVLCIDRLGEPEHTFGEGNQVENYLTPAGAFLSTLTAHTLSSGILAIGSRAGLVS